MEALSWLHVTIANEYGSKWPGHAGSSGNGNLSSGESMEHRYQNMYMTAARHFAYFEYRLTQARH